MGLNLKRAQNIKLFIHQTFADLNKNEICLIIIHRKLI